MNGADGARSQETGSCESFGRRLLELAVSGEWTLAEVYVKSGRSLRFEIGALGVRSVERREETGVAVRLWNDGGREGAVHADGLGARTPEDLVARAREAARRHSGGPRPRLPGEGGSRPPAMIDAGEDASALREFAHRLIGAFSSSGRAATGLRRGWIEAGETAVRIANSHGRNVVRRSRIVSIGLLVEGSAASPSGAGPPAALRYTVEGRSLDEFDPDHLAAEASWRAAASIGGEPIAARSAVVALEPRAAAAFLRSLVPLFVRTAGSPHARSEGLRAAEGLDLIDDPLPGPDGEAPIDGEGREVGRRGLIVGGRPAGCFVDSREENARDDELGPMRRDSFRDAPSPGPMRLVLSPGAPGARGRDGILAGLDHALFVTSLVPHSGPGSGAFVAEVCGVWIERGRARRPVSRTLLVAPADSCLERIVERGSDLEFDSAHAAIGTPTIVLEGMTLIAI